MDMAAAAEAYAKRQRMSEEAIGHAHAIRIDAMRLLGEFLARAPKANGKLKRGPAVPAENHGEPPTLAESGITKRESFQAQKVAQIAESKGELFERLRNGDKPGNPLHRQGRAPKAVFRLRP